MGAQHASPAAVSACQPTDISRDLMMSAMVDLFGSDFKKKITRFRLGTWGNDPFVKGAYSASKPGHAAAREVLAKPVAGRLYFAGEARSERAFCTAHGVWQSGVDALQVCNGSDPA